MTEQTNNEDPVLSIALKVSEVNVILAGLQELPYKVADPLLKSVITQAQVQLGQVPAAAVDLTPAAVED